MKRLLFPALLLLLPIAATAQTSDTSSQDPCKDSSEPTITSFLASSSGRTRADRKEKIARLGDWITLHGCKFNELAETAKKDKKPLRVYINGTPLPGVTPQPLLRGKKISEFRFELNRVDDSEESKKFWSALLGKAKARESKIEVSLGEDGCQEGCTAITDPFSIQLLTLRPWRLVLFIGAQLLILILILRLAKTRGLLRDRGDDSPWSLGRTQMAWWTFFVVGGFLFIWIVTGSYSSLSPSILALLGISSGTALLGAVIDDTKETQRRKREDLEKEGQDLRNRSGALNTEEQERLKEIDRQLDELPQVKKQTAKNNFLLDILSDDGSVSFHRLQIAIWTVVLTAIFIVRVYATLSMPDFDTQLLGLTGISAGTYLGFKFPEKTS